MTTTESATTTTTTTTTTSSEQDANATATTTTTTDSGANFRESQPIQPTKTDDSGEAGADKTEKTDTGEKGRFGIAGKPSTKISFRILTNLSFSLKPYGGLPEKKKFCIKPGGVNGAIKPFTSSSGRKQFKKVGSRIPYTVQALLSVRDKLEFKTIPSEIEQIPGVFEEGLGNFEALINQTITLSSTVTEKISPSKLKKASTTDTSTVTTITTEVTSTYQTTTRYEGNDDDASFRGRGPVTPSKIQKSKLKKREKVSPSIDETTTIDMKPSTDTMDKPKPSEIVSEPTISDTPQQITTSTTESTPSTTTTKSSKPLSSFRSKGAWGRGRKELDPMQRLTKAITIRLNKITLDNFETLSDQLIQIFEKEIINTEQLTKLVSLIFEKTVQEHVYGPLYAKLCVALSSKNKTFEEIVFLNGKKQTRQVDFKNVLVKVCQNEFQKGKRPAVFTEDMDATDRENELFKQNQILKGTMKFIGQLYLKELIPSKIMTVCLKHLVGQTRPSDDDIEGACTLLETVGPTLDADQNVNKNELTKYYQKLKSIQQNSNKYPVRIRMLVQNLIEKRKQNWKGPRGTKSEGPRVLKDRTKTTSIDQAAGAMFDPYDDALPFDFDQLMLGAAGSDAAEIMSIVPKSGHAVAQSQRKYTQSNRYSANAGGSNIVNVTNMRPKKDKNKPIMTQRKKGRSGGGRRRQLLKTAEEEQIMTPQIEEPTYDAYEEKESAPYGGGGGGAGGTVDIGQRKSRMALSSGSDRPCVSGKSVDEEVLEELTGDYLYVRNNVNEQKFLSTLITYQLPSNRSQFVLKFIQKAIDGGKGERFAMILPKLLNEYILLETEFDGGLIEFFKGYTYEDNPQLALNTAQLLAPLIVDNELNFNDVLEWILLDTRDQQPQDDMLQYYDGDGVRNYPKKGPSKDKKITIVMELLGELFKELKEACFEDSQYVKKLLGAYNFSIDRYVNKKDVANIDEIEAAWIKQYGLQFAF